jgi:hypothetical protein
LKNTTVAIKWIQVICMQGWGENQKEQKYKGRERRKKI